MLKIVKKYCYITTLLFAALLVSCGDDDDPPVSPLVGEWELDEITISDPPPGYSMELINKMPNSTILGETEYTFEFLDNFMYEREIDDASLISNGEPISADIEDNGTWELEEEDMDLDQDEIKVNGRSVPLTIPTRFTVVSVNDRALTMTTIDQWYAWPPAIVNDPEALDTVSTDAGFETLFRAHAKVVNAVFTMEFEKE